VVDNRCGLAGAIVVTRVLQRFVFGVTPTDPIVFTLVTLLLVAVGLIAAWRPALHMKLCGPPAQIGFGEASREQVEVARVNSDAKGRNERDSCAPRELIVERP
jgi:hypothetical protein